MNSRSLLLAIPIALSLVSGAAAQSRLRWELPCAITGEDGKKLDSPVEGYVCDYILANNMQFTSLASLTGLPAMSVPVGFDRSGLPIGLQIIGPALAEDQVLRIGAGLQASLDYHRKAPPGF